VVSLLSANPDVRVLGNLMGQDGWLWDDLSGSLRPDVASAPPKTSELRGTVPGGRERARRVPSEWIGGTAGRSRCTPNRAGRS